MANVIFKILTTIKLHLFIRGNLKSVPLDKAPSFQKVPVLLAEIWNTLPDAYSRKFGKLYFF